MQKQTEMKEPALSKSKLRVMRKGLHRNQNAIRDQYRQVDLDALGPVVQRLRHHRAGKTAPVPEPAGHCKNPAYERPPPPRRDIIENKKRAGQRQTAANNLTNGSQRAAASNEYLSNMLAAASPDQRKNILG
ncbi:hypothetical protein WN943_026145 [Citrus x changshan-huyou]